MTTDLSQFHDVFFDEATEHLDSMEQLLLELDASTPDPDALNAIFRAAHSIKGGAGTFGFTDLTQVTHVLETLLDRIRNHELALKPDMVDVFLEAGDVLRTQLTGYREGVEVNPADASQVMARLNELTTPLANDNGFSSTATGTSAGTTHYRITYSPAEARDEVAGNLRAELATLGETTLTNTERGNGRIQYVYSLTSLRGEADIRGIFDFVAQPEEFIIERANNTGVIEALPAEDDGFGFFADAPGAETILQNAADPGYGFFTELPQPAPDKEPGYGFFAPLAAMETSALGTPAAPPVAAERKPVTAKSTEKAGAADTSIRVSVEKVDQMINLVGELVITQAMLAQTVAHLDPVLNERLMDGMVQLERNTRDLQESVMSVRMMPMSFVFSRYPRVVRDLAAKLSKEIELLTEGENTELDKGLIEKIVDPLTHLVRNSLDHGIETPEIRMAAGKERKGTLVLRAAHQGGNVVIEVEDDGAGLNRDKLLAKARERGLAVSDAMSDQEVWQLIFAPGFSTAEKVTDVSGRGVGMDVVKRNIDALGGRVEITSTTGFGTKVAIRLPLTLAILDGMSVAVGDEVFIIPLTYIAESLQPARADIRSVSGQGTLVHVRGEYLPLVSLARVFNFTPRTSDPTQGILVIVESGSGRVALFVDELVGQHQVVIKSLEANYRQIEGIAGATIMGDGRVAMILDITALVRMTQSLTGGMT